MTPLEILNEIFKKNFLMHEFQNCAGQAISRKLLHINSQISNVV